VVVFAKPPARGKVKTRLIPALGETDVVRVAEAFLADTLTLVNEAYWAQPVLATTGSLTLTSQYGLWVWKQSKMKRSDVAVWLQGEGDLGDRLTRVFDRCIKDHGAGLILGADSPGLPYRILANARRALIDADGVIGPTYDGGFYLLGLNSAPKGALKDIPWSTEDTYARTLESLTDLGLDIVILEPFWDIDTPLDWEALCDRQKQGGLAGSATESIINRLTDTPDFHPVD
jgi:rSAM/selenodomain-associated transferase 1